MSTTADDGAVTLYTTAAAALTDTSKNPFSIKVAAAHKLRGGAVVEVSSLHQAKTAQSAGAISVAAVPDPARPGIARMPDPETVRRIKRAVSVPVMGRVRVGHFVEAQILESVGVDYVDENERMGFADPGNFVNKHNFGVPFVCGCRDLGEALSRVREGAAMIRTQGDTFVDTVRHVRKLMGQIRILTNLNEDEVFAFAKKISAPYDIVAQTKQMGRLPVVHFASGGISTAADVAMLMQLGCDGVFVENDVYAYADPYKRLRAVVEAVRNYNDPTMLAEACSGLNLGENSVEFGSGGTY